jgi:hypothetical protein
MKRVARPAFMRMFAAALLAILTLAESVRACSVCNAQSDSSLVDGAVSGVLVMAAVTYVLLGGMGAFIVFWMMRARRLRAMQATSGAAGLDGSRLTATP